MSRSNLQLCDGCGVSFDCDEPDAHYTDDEVCDGGDGPGFFLCSKCGNATSGLGIEARRTLYTEQRERNDAAKREARRGERAAELAEIRASRADRDTETFLDLLVSQGPAWCASMLASACDVESDAENVTDDQYARWSALEEKANELAAEIAALEEECAS